MHVLREIHFDAACGLRGALLLLLLLLARTTTESGAHPPIYLPSTPVQGTTRTGNTVVGKGTHAWDTLTCVASNQEYSKQLGRRKEK